jgi:hypothetical protein
VTNRPQSQHAHCEQNESYDDTGDENSIYNSPFPPPTPCSTVKFRSALPFRLLHPVGHVVEIELHWRKMVLFKISAAPSHSVSCFFVRLHFIPLAFSVLRKSLADVYWQMLPPNIPTKCSQDFSSASSAISISLVISARATQTSTPLGPVKLTITVFSPDFLLKA